MALSKSDIRVVSGQALQGLNQSGLSAVARLFGFKKCVAMKRMAGVVFVAVFLVSASAVAPARAEDDRWADFRFLIGAWVTAGKAEDGSGGFTLEPEFGGKILVRRNTLELPAAKGRPAGKHEDLMIVYLEPGGKQVRASYFDSEDHIIQYSVTPLPGKKGLVFVSEANSSGPRFRLTYNRVEEDKVGVTFEIAPPGKPDEFQTYLEGTASRTRTGK